MDKEFDLSTWDDVAIELKKRYPHLTTADLLWRHETKSDFYKMIASELGITASELEQIVAQVHASKS